MRYVFVVGPTGSRRAPPEHLCVSWGQDLVMTRGPDVATALNRLLEVVPREQVICDEDIAVEARALELAVGSLPQPARGVKALLILQMEDKRAHRGMTLEDTARGIHDAERLIAALDGLRSNEGRLDRH